MPSPDVVTLDGLGVSEADLLAALEAEDAAALAAGAVSGDDVWFEFITQDDDRVRPGHAALHGSVWRVGDPAAPVPPIDYGCRCGMRYVAPPGGKAAKLLPLASTVPKSHAEVLGAWLADRFKVTPDGLGKVVGSLDKVPLADRQGAAVARVQAKLQAMGEPGTITEARPLASMLLAVTKPRAPELPPGTTPPGPVVPPPAPPVRPAGPSPAPAPPPPPAPAPPVPAPPPARQTLAERAAAARPVAEASWGKPAMDWTKAEREANRVVGRAAALDAFRAIAPLRAEAVASAKAHADATAAQEAAYRTYQSAPLGSAVRGTFRDAWMAAQRREVEALAAHNALGDRIRAAVVAANPRPVSRFPAWASRIEAPTARAVPALAGDLDVGRFGSLVSASSGWVPERVSVTPRGVLRGSADRNGAGHGVHKVNLSGRPGVASHELAHTLEYDAPGVIDAAVAFLRRRTAGKPLQWLNETHKGAGYGKGEVYRDGGFVDAYVGKDYGRACLAARMPANAGGGKKAAKAAAPYSDYFKGDGNAASTEVVSMGVEWLAMRPADLLARDPDHFRLAVRAAMGAL